MLNAAEAKAITEKAKQPKNPWDVLFTLIEETAQDGHSVCQFDEEHEGAYFEESREDVAEKLNELGYRVEHRRALNNFSYKDGCFHNLFIIRW